MGLQMLCEGKRAFVNCTREVQLKDYVTLFPSTHTVVEVPESVPSDDLVKAALQRLKQAGYMIALDDFLVDDPRAELVDFADILKVDLQMTTVQDRATLIKRYGSWHCRMLVKRVETREHFAEAKAGGFIYFQGFFFRNPELMHAREIPANL